MIHGETVRVIDRVKTGVDAHKSPVYSPIAIDVPGVVVAPGEPGSASEDNRQDSALIRYTLYFPKTYKEELYGKSIEVRGKTCKVIGRPLRYTDSNVPGKWNMPVEVESIDG